MSRRHPEAFPIDDKRVYDAYVAGRASAAMAVGVRLGLFDLLDKSPSSAEQIATALELQARPARSLLAALVGTGLLLLEGEAYSLPEDASAYLVRNKPGSLWGLVDMEVDEFLDPAKLMRALKQDDASVYGGGDPWEAHAADPAKAAAFTAAMHSVSARPAAGFAEVAPLASTKRLLDVGGGSGALSIACAQANPDLRCTLFDISVVCDLAADYVRDADLLERITPAPGDMFTEAFPEGHDAVLLSQILHDWSFETGAELLAKAYDCLPSGGQVLIHEKLVDDDGLGPRANTLVHLDMLVWTKGQQYRPSELSTALHNAGFTNVQIMPTAGYWSLAVATKP
ncbi:MAG: hypothetical protein ACI8QC_000408 [Planctomycetota bacterium]|jgi:hypothetical protein